MFNLTVEAKCDSGFIHTKGIEVPGWTSWIAVDGNGAIWGWRYRPVRGLNGWLAATSVNVDDPWSDEDDPWADENALECGRINPGLSCEFSNWKELIWAAYDLLSPQEQGPDVSDLLVDSEPVIVGPYVGKRINWIKDVRLATGAGLWTSKWAVDCALAAGHKGTQADFVNTVRFLIDGKNKRLFNLDDHRDDANFNEALSALENGRNKDNLVDFTLEFWGKDE